MAVYSFGYDGWGPYVPQLLETLRRVSAGRGRGMPLLVDSRARREVRAPGFTTAGIAKWATRDDYLWLCGLGNAYVARTRTEYTIERKDWRKTAILDGREIARLADVAAEAENANRDLMVFCQCPLPKENPHPEERSDCHRLAVMELLNEEFERRGVTLVIQEWPGGEPRHVDLKLSRVVANALLRQHYRKTVSFDPAELPILQCLPWGSRVVVTVAEGDEPVGGFITGPARPTKRREWMLPVLERPVSRNAVVLLGEHSNAFIQRHGLCVVSRPAERHQR